MTSVWFYDDEVYYEKSWIAFVYKSCVKLFLHQRDTVQIIREVQIPIRMIFDHSWSAESKDKVGWVIDRKLHESKHFEKCIVSFLEKYKKYYFDEN